MHGEDLAQHGIVHGQQGFEHVGRALGVSGEHAGGVGHQLLGIVVLAAVPDEAHLLCRELLVQHQRQLPGEEPHAAQAFGHAFGLEQGEDEVQQDAVLAFLDLGFQLQQRVGDAQGAVRGGGTRQRGFVREPAFQHGLQQVLVAVVQAVGRLHEAAALAAFAEIGIRSLEHRLQCGKFFGGGWGIGLLGHGKKLSLQWMKV